MDVLWVLTRLEQYRFVPLTVFIANSGKIQQKTRNSLRDSFASRAIYVLTAKILDDLQQFAPWDVDILTLSGSGEPTLALNLGEILTSIQQCTRCPTLVLTNGT